VQEKLYDFLKEFLRNLLLQTQTILKSYELF